MRPISNEFPTSQNFGDGATAGIVGNRYASQDTMEYYVGIYGNYQPFGHAGMDIACPIGTPIHAPADGTVLYAGWTEDLPGNGEIRQWLFYYNFGGILTVIQHDGWISAIAHQSSNDEVYVGMQVTEGQLIGKSGNTKTRTTSVAAHAHCEALVYLNYHTDVRNGVIYGRVDPTRYFGGIAAQGTTTTPQEDEVSFTNEVIKDMNGGETTPEKALSSVDRKITAALAAITGLLSVQLSDPTDPGKTYALADWIVWSATNAKLAAGAAGKAVENTNPDTLAKAIAQGAASVDAQAIADQLQINVTVKE